MQDGILILTRSCAERRRPLVLFYGTGRKVGFGRMPQGLRFCAGGGIASDGACLELDASRHGRKCEPDEAEARGSLKEQEGYPDRFRLVGRAEAHTRASRFLSNCPSQVNPEPRG